MPKLIIMRGLPASGKSTRSATIMEQSGNTVRLNKDLLRTMLHCDKWSNQNERLTIKAEEELAIAFMLCDKNVIIDDTNLNPHTLQHWKDFATTRIWKWEVVDLTNVSVKECLARDLVREKKVGSHVILGMAMQYLEFLKGEDVCLIDIDGTLANIDHRLHYVKGEEKDWKGFFSEIHNDTLRKDVVERVEKLNPCYFFFVSGRPEEYRKETEKWMTKNGIDPHIFPVFMREKGDHRDDTIVKSEIYDRYFKRTNVVAVFDDRPKVIRMWKGKGLNVIDVGKGIEF